MIYVYFFLRSLCSLLPTHINFSWSRWFIQKCFKIACGCFFLPLFANPRIVLNFIPDLYLVLLNCFCLLFFIMVVTIAISLKLIVFWKLYPSCLFTMFTLFCRSHFIWLLSRSCSTNLLKFWRSITRAHIYCNTRLPWWRKSCLYLCSSLRMRQILIKGQNSSKIPDFCTFWRSLFTDFDDSLEPSSGFSVPFLCISHRLDQNWGSLLQTLPQTHTVTQIIVR